MNLNQQLMGIKERVLSSLETYWGFVPPSLKETLRINAYTLWKIPQIAFLSPRVVEVSDEKITIRIPLNYRSRNHVGSMYFGSLAVGADLVVGTMALRHIEKTGQDIQILFKSFQADYLKRAEDDVYFTCEKGSEISQLVDRAAGSGERVQMPIEAYATVPSLFGNEPVARFTLTLSLKNQDKKMSSSSSSTSESELSSESNSTQDL